ncbi:ATPase [Rhodopseudomonas palustris HaA2]|uniref:ATPase n=1 Tax=Rhodopseudomonas palustris (strain HaA2) TaxID=316058 RepID=Q2IVJ6_RHOP2|nr:AAA family ATPase [Rhodopseudomonas palustris]ABD07764.1 ATPase [Rhodopseudomonas palustris HaA2]
MIGNDDDGDVPPSPDAVDLDATVDGAAADSADSDQEHFQGLPRLLRYAMLARDNVDDTVVHRLIAEIDELSPKLPQNADWAAAQNSETGFALAAELDQLAVVRDLPLLRSLSDCVRLLTLTLPCDPKRFGAYRRVARAMIFAFRQIEASLDDERCAELERIVYGFAALPAAIGANDSARSWPAISSAAHLGEQSVRHRLRAVVVRTSQSVRRQIERQTEPKKPKDTPSIDATTPHPPVNEPIAPNHVIVARIEQTELKNLKFIEPFRHVLNNALPLVEATALDRVRTTLAAEFPYAVEVVDFMLTDLIGRPTIRLRPLLLVEAPGSGKSRFARRLGELLGVAIWRTDASQSDGNVFAGTDRRWNSAEPCHPLLAIARGKIANPIVIIDEIEKAGTRSDNGRLWDCLLGLLEPETNARYPDPALQTPLDLSHVSYVATANTLDPLPSPLLDRLRIIAFPKPTLDDLNALLPGLIEAIAEDRGVDGRWIAPLDAHDCAAIAAVWPGGSVRRLRRAVEFILQQRDRTAPRH